MEIKESSRKFCRVNYGEEMPEDLERILKRALFHYAKWFENYEDAIKCAGEESVLGIKNETVVVYEVTMAPPDYGEKRYCAKTDMEYLTRFAGFKYIDQYGNPLPSASIEGLEHIKDIW